MVTPWQLITSATIPSSVVWLPLSSKPAPPITLAAVQALVVPGLQVGVEYGMPQVVTPSQLAYRAFSAELLVPGDATGLPFAVVKAMAVVDTDGPGQLLDVFTLDTPWQGQAWLDRLRFSGYLQCSTLSGAGNG